MEQTKNSQSVILKSESERKKTVMEPIEPFSVDSPLFKTTCDATMGTSPVIECRQLGMVRHSDSRSGAAWEH